MKWEELVAGRSGEVAKKRWAQMVKTIPGGRNMEMNHHVRSLTPAS